MNTLLSFISDSDELSDDETLLAPESAHRTYDELPPGSNPAPHTNYKLSYAKYFKLAIWIVRMRRRCSLLKV